MESELASFARRVCSRIGTERERLAAQEEILDHLMEAARELEAQGMPADEAQRSAMERFGDPDMIGRELARVYGTIPFRYFALGGAIWFAIGALLFELDAFWISDHWLLQLPLQLLGLPHWAALQAPQIEAATGLLDSLRWHMGRTWSISPWHLDAAIAAIVLTPAAYGVYRVIHRVTRVVGRPETRQAWSLLVAAFRD